MSANEPKQEEQPNMIESVIGDDHKKDASSPVNTVGAFFNTLFAFGAGAAVLDIASGAGEVISNAMGGGLDTVGELAQTAQQNLELGLNRTAPTVGGMNGMKFS